MQNLPQGKKIILFDGVCNLCNSFVQYVIERDKKDTFRFASLQSEIGEEILNHIGIDRSKTDSIILYEPGIAYYYKSSAALEIAKSLSGFVSWSFGFKILPTAFRDWVYDYVAKNRYKWFGKQESCWLPTPELKGKFID
ncbi:thiol-disulfide oxidoreductase DCC family protein [Flavobacterium sp. SE-s28]|uniref:Thiol-disulfide oxidoreductase DCC family protein n=1 Tax=Flavobacterium silvaticum TaxID=1852020 RepID=A0A972JKD4_9FLAO|nr:thiol-disulfide oxidoreductase DCC family protein [Flavobacterium silvaticum]